ncbi:MAG: YbaB/EbfC family nucleoid-associated protein [Kiritimatiellae bacterium]|nr:YbaB/EbfC family nucleoid-associated protein [Kiritimatiellia bacterium]MBR0056200.1 YbaB/EbfC family nucleoid-associated protein [Kiritimatiellia bacterium]
MPNFMKMLKQATEIQKNMAKAQEDLVGQTLEASSGGGAVTVTITGAGDITAIKISPDVAKSGDAEMLEDLVLSAVKSAQEQARDTSSKTMAKLTGGLQLPPGFGF